MKMEKCGKRIPEQDELGPLLHFPKPACITQIRRFSKRRWETLGGQVIPEHNELNTLLKINHIVPPRSGELTDATLLKGSRKRDVLGLRTLLDKSTLTSWIFYRTRLSDKFWHFRSRSTQDGSKTGNLHWRPNVSMFPKIWTEIAEIKNFAQRAGIWKHVREFGANVREFGANVREFGPKVREFGPNVREFGPNVREFLPKIFEKRKRPEIPQNHDFF